MSWIESIQDKVGDNQVDNIKILNFTHVTEAANVFNILEEKKLKASNKCPIFNEDLVFLTYGKATYMGKKDEKERLNHNNAPICFLIPFTNKFVNINAVKHIYPSDSGFIGKIFDDDSNDVFSDFLKEDILSNGKLIYSDVNLKKIIKFFYDSNEDYLNNKINIFDREFRSKYDINLLKDKVLSQFHENILKIKSLDMNADINRLFGIELLIQKHLKFKDLKGLKLFFPSCHLELIQDFQDQYRFIEVIGYGDDNMITDGRAFVFYSQLQKEVRNYIEENLLNKKNDADDSDKVNMKL